MADYKITPAEPFTVEGVGGTVYELPRLLDISSEQMAGLNAVRNAKELEDQVGATKAFVLSLCPDLADEPLTDMGYMALFAALAEGSGIEMGESVASPK